MGLILTHCNCTFPPFQLLQNPHEQDSHPWIWRQYASPKRRIFYLLRGTETQTWKLSTKYFIFCVVFKHLISNPSEISKILWIGLQLFIIIIIIIIRYKMWKILWRHILLFNIRNYQKFLVASLCRATVQLHILPNEFKSFDGFLLNSVRTTCHYCAFY